MKNSKCVYVTITLPPEFLEMMDKSAREQMMKRSEYIRAAVNLYIKYLRKEKIT